jgi:TIR domain
MSNGIRELKEKIIVGGVVLRKRRFDVAAVPPPPTPSLPMRKLRVFLSHASEDKPKVREIKQALLSHKVEPWLDSDELKPGVPWNDAIWEAMENSDIILLCFSRTSVNKKGFVQRELRMALDLANEQPLDTIFLIPARLDECKVSIRLGHLQWVNLFEENGIEKLIKILEERAENLALNG